jgi:hypothetical protein
MIAKVLRLVALPLVLLLIWTIARFALGVSGMPYAPRGNAMFSVFGLTLISCIYYGALSKNLAGFGWGGTILTGYTLGLAAQILIFIATLVSYLMGVEGTSYFAHWDSLNVPEGTMLPLSKAMTTRALGLVFGPIFPIVAAVIGRLLASLVPKPQA